MRGAARFGEARVELHTSTSFGRAGGLLHDYTCMGMKTHRLHGIAQCKQYRSLLCVTSLLQAVCSPAAPALSPLPQR
jgi:hypothetical protein